MRRRSRFFIAFLLTLMLVAIAASPSFAAPAKEGGVTIISIEELQKMRESMADAAGLTGLTGAGGAGGNIAASGEVVVNEWGCYGQTEYPHRSTDDGVYVVRVHARSACPDDVVPYLWVETQVYREFNCVFSTCFGIEPWGPDQDRSRKNAYLVDVFADGPCLDTTYYKGISAHKMTGPDGNDYAAFTSDRAKVVCP